MQVIFCSERCKTLGNQLFHARECNHLGTISCCDVIESNFILSYRRLLSESWAVLSTQPPFNTTFHTRRGGDGDASISATASVPNKKNPFRVCDKCGSEEVGKERPNFDLPSHGDLRSEVQRLIFRRKAKGQVSQLWLEALTAIYLAKVATAAGVLVMDNDRDAEFMELVEDSVARFLFAHSLADARLTRGLLCYGIKTVDRFDVRCFSVGSGLCSSVAPFFHSCVPNVVQCYVAGDVVFR